MPAVDPFAFESSPSISAIPASPIAPYGPLPFGPAAASDLGTFLGEKTLPDEAAMPDSAEQHASRDDNPEKKERENFG